MALLNIFILMLGKVKVGRVNSYGFQKLQKLITLKIWKKKKIISMSDAKACVCKLADIDLAYDFLLFTNDDVIIIQAW